MQTHWGDIPVNDAHVHFFSHGFFSLLAKQKPGLTVDEMGATLGWEMPAVEPVELAARWLRELDGHGVDRAVLIASLPGDEGSVAAAIQAHPERVWGYFFCVPSAPDAPERAGRAIEAGLRGVCLFPAMHGYSLHDERVTAILELARSKPGTVVFVHCGVLTVGIRNRLGLASPFDMRFSNPLDLHGPALRHPEVNFVVPHFGAGYFREALMLSDLCGNVWLDTSSSNSWTRYQPEQLDLKGVFERALEVAGPGRLLFGTDSSFFPRGWNRQVFEVQAEALASAGATAAEARAVLGGNLAKLLG
ncbi:MAG: amidohydrolase [bacterium]|nr:amidohydrolase [bacterium]